VEAEYPPGEPLPPRRDRFSATAAESIAALNHSAQRSFAGWADPRSHSSLVRWQVPVLSECATAGLEMLFNFDKTMLFTILEDPAVRAPRSLGVLIKDQASQCKSTNAPDPFEPMVKILRREGQKTLDLGPAAA
jgi:hypothetical protein